MAPTVALGRQVTREASIYLSGFVGAAVLQFLAVPIYTRYLGPERYAFYALALAVTTSLAGMLVIGGDVALTRFWFQAHTQQQRRDLALTWISFLTAWSIVVVGVAALFTNALADALRPDSDLGPLLLVGLMVLIPAQLSRMLAQVLRNEFRPGAFALTTVLVGAMAMGLGLALSIGAGLGVLGILLGALIAEVLGVTIRLPMVRQDLRGSLRREALGPPLRFGIPFVPASIAMWVFTGADRLAVARYLPAVDLGGYAVAATLVAPFSVLLTALGQAWMPRVTQEFSLSSERAARSTGRAIELSLIIYSFGATIVAVAAPLAIALVAGPGFDSGASALPLLALGSTFLGTSLFTGTGYTLAKRTALVPVLTVLAAIVNIGCLVLLVPRWGLVGAALAVCAGYFTLTVGSYAYSRRHFPVSVNWWILSLVTATTGVMAVSASAFPSSVATFALAALAVIVQLLAARSVAKRSRRPLDSPRKGASTASDGAPA